MQGLVLFVSAYGFLPRSVCSLILSQASTQQHEQLPVFASHTKSMHVLGYCHTAFNAHTLMPVPLPCSDAFFVTVRHPLQAALSSVVSARQSRRGRAAEMQESGMIQV